MENNKVYEDYIKLMDIVALYDGIKYQNIYKRALRDGILRKIGKHLYVNKYDIEKVINKRKRGRKIII